MVVTLAFAVTAVAVAWGAYAAWLAWRDRLVDDAALILALLVEAGLLVLAVVAALRFRRIDPHSEGATFLAYALSLPVVPPMALFVAIKEKTRWAMVVGVVAAVTVAVMAARIAQIWNLYAR
ncbi:MAG: hypothetical protein IPH03_15085 [Tetrasphaera sp.]|nr:hypothetical protein [Tetrasphaera sp.]